MAEFGGDTETSQQLFLTDLLHVGSASPSAKALQRKPEGAAHMSAQHHVHSLRGQRRPPSSGAAGLLSSATQDASSMHVHEKAHERPRPARALVPGQSHVSIKDLLGHPDNDDTAGVSWRSCDTAAAAATATRMVRKMNTAMSFKAAMGQGMEIVEAVEVARPLQGQGTFKPTRDTSRVFLADKGSLRRPDGSGEGEQMHMTPYKLTTWEAQVEECEARTAADAERRPHSARGAPWARDEDARPMSASRKAAHQAQMGSNDVFRYRYSHGICPEVYKFSPEGHKLQPSKAAPEAVVVSAKEKFVDSRAEYTCNRVRGLSSGPIY